MKKYKFKQIDGYGMKYGICKEGLIWSRNKKMFLKTQVIQGNCYVSLNKDNNRKRYNLKTLVYKHFGKHNGNFGEVFRVDGNPDNNHIKNLYAEDCINKDKNADKILFDDYIYENKGFYEISGIKRKFKNKKQAMKVLKNLDLKKIHE